MIAWLSLCCVSDLQLSSFCTGVLASLVLKSRAFALCRGLGLFYRKNLENVVRKVETAFNMIVCTPNHASALSGTSHT